MRWRPLSTSPPSPVPRSHVVPGKAFDRVKPKNRERLEQAVAQSRIRLEHETTVGEIGIERVTLRKADADIVLPNDRVLCARAANCPLDAKKIGIEVEAHYGS